MAILRQVLAAGRTTPVGVAIDPLIDGGQDRISAPGGEQQLNPVHVEQLLIDHGRSDWKERRRRPTLLQQRKHQIVVTRISIVEGENRGSRRQRASTGSRVSKLEQIHRCVVRADVLQLTAERACIQSIQGGGKPLGRPHDVVHHDRRRRCAAGRRLHRPSLATRCISRTIGSITGTGSTAGAATTDAV